MKILLSNYRYYLLLVGRASPNLICYLRVSLYPRAFGPWYKCVGVFRRLQPRGLRPGTNVKFLRNAKVVNMVEILLIFKIHIFIISGASKCPFSQRYRFPNRSSPSIPSTPHSPMRVSVFRLQVPGFKVSGFGFRVRVSGLASRVKV